MDKVALRFLLRERRALIAPEAHGLSRPTRQGRRAPGLSQAQVDQLLHRAPDTYGRLESGRYPNPPVDLLEDVARLLGMNEHDWMALWRYALGQDPPHPLHTRSGEVVPGVWREVLDGISHMAYVSDRSWNLLAYNEPFAALFAGRRVPDNVMHWMTVAPEGRAMLVRWETAWAPLVLPQLRAALAADPHDPVLAGIERDVLADPVAARIYESAGAYLRPREGERPVHHAEQGPGWVTVCAAQPMAAPRARLMILPFRAGERPAGGRTLPLRARRGAAGRTGAGVAGTGHLPERAGKAWGAGRLLASRGQAHIRTQR
ncbi:helix-turn-helix domain-containing protein [Streptomyces sp. MUM 203J]|uniref:MmyB family transcriptional regulator n=1 Tax=Streptomyces sp. MUM 203J TaxID=2791990 RepID=UPI001F04D9BE|nr:helix-turn-helix domain-containing protein [Streptomyces sp. MUM 203J]MCH0542918.1 helix-turn-helix domain-containing protein [Streptomyces sp. MUM 203J]